MEVPRPVKPWLVVVIGHVDDQTGSLPPATGIAHPQLDVGCGMRTPVNGNDASSVLPVEEEQEESWILNNLKCWRDALVMRPGDPGHHTIGDDRIAKRRVRIEDVLRPLLLHCGRPRLVRHLPIRRVHNRRSRPGLDGNHLVVCRLRSLFDVLKEWRRRSRHRPDPCTSGCPSANRDGAQAFAAAGFCACAADVVICPPTGAAASRSAITEALEDARNRLVTRGPPFIWEHQSIKSPNVLPRGRKGGRRISPENGRDSG